jgi:hypothetical protein
MKETTVARLFPKPIETWKPISVEQQEHLARTLEQLAQAVRDRAPGDGEINIENGLDESDYLGWVDITPNGARQVDIRIVWGRDQQFPPGFIR